MGGHVAAASRVSDRDGPHVVQGFVDQFDQRLFQFFQIRLDQLSTGKMFPAGVHQSSGVRVRKRENDLQSACTSRTLESRLQRRLQPFHFRRPEQAVVQRDENQRRPDVACTSRIGRSRISSAAKLFNRRKRQHGGFQIAMHAGGPVVRRRPPHAVINPHRRRDRSRPITEPAETMRCRDGGHGTSIKERFRIRLRFADHRRSQCQYPRSASDP